MENEQTKKCSYCNNEKSIKEYISGAGRELSMCKRYRDIKQRTPGKYYCEHNRPKTMCKECGDPIKITIKRMISSSKQKDTYAGRYDANNFINKCFIEMLIDESTLYHYCKVQMQFINNDDTLCTIERLNTYIGHTKANCVLACRKCNLSKVGEKIYEQIEDPFYAP